MKPDMNDGIIGIREKSHQPEIIRIHRELELTVRPVKKYVQEEAAQTDSEVTQMIQFY